MTTTTHRPVAATTVGYGVALPQQTAHSTPTARQYANIGPLATESSVRLNAVTIAYETWGTLNPMRDNAVLVLHALTGDSHVVGPAGADQPTPGWWDGLIAAGAPLDTDRFFVIAANVLGGCRGITGPSSPAPDGRRTARGSRGSPSATRWPRKWRWPTTCVSIDSPWSSAV